MRKTEMSSIPNRLHVHAEDMEMEWGVRNVSLAHWFDDHDIVSFVARSDFTTLPDSDPLNASFFKAGV